MKASELRIGNLLQSNYGALLKAVELKEENEISTITTYVVDRSKFPQLKGWKAQPIPLTEDWLLKLGFNQSKGQWGNTFI